MASLDDADNIYHCTLSKELKEKAEKELNEKDEYRTKDIQALRERVLANKGRLIPFYQCGYSIVPYPRGCQQ